MKAVGIEKEDFQFLNEDMIVHINIKQAVVLVRHSHAGELARGRAARMDALPIEATEGSTRVVDEGTPLDIRRLQPFARVRELEDRPQRPLTRTLVLLRAPERGLDHHLRLEHAHRDDGVNEVKFAVLAQHGVADLVGVAVDLDLTAGKGPRGVNLGVREGVLQAVRDRGSLDRRVATRVEEALRADALANVFRAVSDLAPECSEHGMR